jgi:ABC-type Na+ efflux pump permease subunit
MANDIFLGQTDSVSQYDGSGVFKPTYGDEKPADYSYDKPEETEILVEPEESKKPEESSTGPLLMYAGAALLLYFFVFKKK